MQKVYKTNNAIVNNAILQQHCRGYSEKNNNLIVIVITSYPIAE